MTNCGPRVCIDPANREMILDLIDEYLDIADSVFDEEGDNG